FQIPCISCKIIKCELKMCTNKQENKNYLCSDVEATIGGPQALCSIHVGLCFPRLSWNLDLNPCAILDDPTLTLTCSPYHDKGGKISCNPWTPVKITNH
uniref:Uncharacterized protein n=1 Tax=Oryzias latipes TaxID=8090 RepID=A0A3P9JFC4_ORYLA